jgi:hypothetical protein
MRIVAKQLSGLKRRWKLPVIILAAVVLSAGVIYDLNTRKSELQRLTTEVEALEAQIAAIDFPTGAETTEWAAEEETFRSALLGEESVPLLFAEITRIGSDNRIQGITINTEEHNLSPDAAVQDGSAPPGHDADLLAVGIARYSAVTIRFQGLYPDVAGFLDAVSRLPYSISVRTVDLKRTIPLIDGTLLLHVYKRGAA